LLGPAAAADTGDPGSLCEGSTGLGEKRRSDAPERAAPGQARRRVSGRRRATQREV